MDSRPLFLHFTLAAALLSAMPAMAADFPGGDPITAADLTATAPQLPAPPPAYDAAKDSPDHTEFARFAWREFIALNAPAQQVSSPSSGQSPVVRGTVASTGTFVQGGKTDFYSSGASSTCSQSRNQLVWQSYAHRSELFPNGQGPRAAFTTLQPNYVMANVTVSPAQSCFNNLDENSQIGQNRLFFPKSGSTPSSSPLNDYPVLFEAKANQTEYDFINGLGQTPSPPSLTLPDESVEIKAAWRMLTAEQAQSGRYHTAQAVYYTGDDKAPTPQVGTFGLIALHIIRKMANYPAFVFATFEQQDSLTNPSGSQTGLYFILNYDMLCYGVAGSSPDPAACTLAGGTPPSQPSVIINTGPNKVVQNLPAAGQVTTANGYPFSPGGSTVNPPFSGPIQVQLPPTATQAVYGVNNEVKAAMLASDQFGDSVWRYYALTGVQPMATNEDSSVGSNNPLTQDFFLANIVVESSQPGIQLFKGAVSGPTTTSPHALFGNPRSGSNAYNIRNVAGYPSDNTLVMGGCMGCHGNATYTAPTQTVPTSVFSFVLRQQTRYPAGFTADTADEPFVVTPELKAKIQRYATLFR